MNIELRLDIRVETLMGALALAVPRLPDAGWLNHPIRRRACRRWSGLSNHDAPRLLRSLLGRTFWVDDLCRLSAALLTVREGQLCSRFPCSAHSESSAAAACDRFAFALQDFAERTRLPDILEEGAEIPSEVLQSVGGMSAIAAWDDHARLTLGPGPSQIRIFPSPLCSAHLGFGPTAVTENGPEGWVIFGPVWRPDWKRWKLCGFDSPKLARLIRHELGHLHLNHHTAAAPEVARFEPLFAPLRPEMRSLGYGRWDICLNELILRAVEIQRTAEYEGRQAAQRLRQRELRKGFVLINDAEQALSAITGAPVSVALPEFLNALARAGGRSIV